MSLAEVELGMFWLYYLFNASEISLIQYEFNHLATEWLISNQYFLNFVSLSRYVAP